MSMKDRIPLAVVKLLKKIRHYFRLLTKSTRNSFKAFRPIEIGYRLSISKFGPFEIAYREGTADEGVIAHSFDHDIFFSRIPRYIHREDHIIIDVGAHIGTFALLAATKVPAGRVFAIEACQETYNILKINIAINHLQNVQCSHLALSDKRGFTKLHYNVGNWGHSITKKHTLLGEDVPTDTLAGYMADHAIARCHLIKFNCEGAEFPILLSTSPDVLQKIDRMIVLYHCDLIKGYTIDDLVPHLQRNGFNLHFLNETRQRGWIMAERPE